VAASPGRYRGPVCVLKGEREVAKFRPGDVLVCPINSPVWSILFANVGALVTATGGILSHSAIIAPAYRVRRWLRAATRRSLSPTGRVVTVDGTAGTLDADGGTGDQRRAPAGARPAAAAGALTVSGAAAT
jgi:phosphohistidine swiveling domain-containing protein